MTFCNVVSLLQILIISFICKVQFSKFIYIIFLRYGAAELDCTTSIALDPLYVKSYLRRATARSAMGKFKEASEDFKRVLYLEPTNKHAASELDRLKKVCFFFQGFVFTNKKLLRLFLMGYYCCYIYYFYLLLLLNN